MWKKITLITTYIIGVFLIITAIGGHVNYANWAVTQYGLKFAPAVVQQHLYSALLIIGTIVAVMAMITYALTRKPQ